MNSGNVFFVCHGEPKKLPKYGYGDALSDQGAKQSEQAAQKFKTGEFSKYKINSLVSSPLLIAGATARIFKEALSLTGIQASQGLRSRKWGIYEAQTKESWIKEEGNNTSQYTPIEWAVKNPDWQPPSGESETAFKARVMNAVGVIAKDQNVIVVTHPDVIDSLYPPNSHSNTPFGGIVHFQWKPDSDELQFVKLLELLKSE